MTDSSDPPPLPSDPQAASATAATDAPTEGTPTEGVVLARGHLHPAVLLLRLLGALRQNAFPLALGVVGEARPVDELEDGPVAGAAVLAEGVVGLERVGVAHGCGVELLEAVAGAAVALRNGGVVVAGLADVRIREPEARLALEVAADHRVVGTSSGVHGGTPPDP